MAQRSHESDETVESLQQEAENKQKEYDEILKQHLKVEKALRDKRYKLETQLANVMGRYDKEVGGVHRELVYEKEAYEEEKTNMINLENKYIDQEEIYLVLMEEKRIEETRLENLVVEQFLALRAAKLIQKWWRSVKRNKPRHRSLAAAKKRKSKK